jgi:hypothetical protein
LSNQPPSWAKTLSDSPGYVKQETELFRDATDMGELYLYRIRRPEFGKRLVDSLELIADRNNHRWYFIAAWARTGPACSRPCSNQSGEGHEQ